MWISVLHVVVCVAAIIHVASPQPASQPKRSCCSDAPCLGRCYKGYCPYGYRVRPSAFCRCPTGSICCQWGGSTTSPCEKCNSMFRCVSNHVHCAYLVITRDCSCPPGKKCCKGPFCFECGGQCIKGSFCVRPFYPMPPGSNCPCPRGMTCCKEATCESSCKPWKCVSSKSICNHKVYDTKCTCPPDNTCCKFTCEAAPCNSLCLKDKCPSYMKPPKVKIACTCPNGYKCCRGKCRYKTRTPVECMRIGGWVIPATNLPTGRVCCKPRTCEKNCKAFKAQCARKATCKYALVAPKCDCPPGSVCCKYTCELSGCNGKCIRGPCLTGMKEKPGTCTCPVGFSCCVSPCPYEPCITKAKCERHDGLSIPALHCPKDTVCCKGTCRCPYKQCTKLAECTKSGGDPIPSSNCLNGRVCCHFGATATPYTPTSTSAIELECPKVVGPGPCIITCSVVKDDCRDGKKCCSNGCGLTCQVPVPIELVCPKVVGPGPCIEACSVAKDDCPDGKKCCFNGCGHTCQVPVLETTTTTTTTFTKTTTMPPTPTLVGCPNGFRPEGTKYVLRKTCFIMFCNPWTGALSSLTCPLVQPPQPDICRDVELKKEGCHEGFFEDKTKVYGECCPVWKKFCPGDVGFDASKVPTVTLPPDETC